jgi:hypothetical protein
MKASKKANARKIVDGLSETELRVLVLERLNGDPELESILLSRYVKGKGLKTLERLFDLALAKAGEPDDYGYWDEAFYSDFIMDLEGIEKEAKQALAKGDHDRALQAYFMLIERVAKMSDEGDDHDGSLMSAVNEWMEALHGYAGGKKATPAGLKLLREWARASESSAWAKNGDSWDESCRHILIRCARSATELRAELKKALTLADSGGQGWHDEQRCERAALDSIDLFTRLEDSAGRRAFIDSHLHFPDVRSIAIDEAVKAKDWVKAESLAREGMARTGPAKRYGGSERFSERLWEILRQAKKKEAAAAFELERFLSTQGNDWYRRLKKRYLDSWTEYREGLFAKAIAVNFGAGVLASLYASERLYDRLLALCEKNERLFELHYHSLGPAYPEETAVWLKGWIERNCQRAQSRSFYVDIGKRIAEYGRYAGGQRAKALVDALMLRYPNRPAMRQEFMKALQTGRNKKSEK